MVGGVILNIYSLIIIIVLNFLFFLKPKTNNREVRIYKKLLIVSLLMNLSGLLISYAVANSQYNILLIITNKLYLIFLVLWIIILTYYVFTTAFIKNECNEKKTKRISYIISIISILLIIILPIKINNVNEITISGLSVFFSYSLFFIGFFSQLIFIIIDIKNAKNKKYLPIYLLAILGSIAATIIMSNQYLNYIINPILIFIIFVMYNTIENPDLRIIQEFANNRKLIEENIEEKSNILFEISQEVRNPLNEIMSITSNFNEYNNKELVRDALSSINYKAKKTSLFINNILNITTINENGIKDYHNYYNPRIIFESLKLKTIQDNPGCNVSLIISKGLPSELYGDQVKLKQIISSVINYAIKRKDKEIDIEIKVNCINKYDICRLIIFITDTGNIININEINNILNNNYDAKEDLTNLNVSINTVNSLLKQQGGYLMINSENQKGTEIKISIDQKIRNNTNMNSKKILDNYINKRKIAVVSNKTAVINKIKKNAKDYNISSFMFSSDLIKSIESNENYNIIIVEDEMYNESGYDIFKKLKEKKDFNIPVIILLSKNKDSIKNHYLEEGFDDYIIIENMIDEIKKIEKY